MFPACGLILDGILMVAASVKKGGYLELGMRPFQLYLYGKHCSYLVLAKSNAHPCKHTVHYRHIRYILTSYGAS
jgi:hypothetical protein